MQTNLENAKNANFFIFFFTKRKIFAFASFFCRLILCIFRRKTEKFRKSFLLGMFLLVCGRCMFFILIFSLLFVDINFVYFELEILAPFFHIQFVVCLTFSSQKMFSLALSLTNFPSWKHCVKLSFYNRCDHFNFIFNSIAKIIKFISWKWFWIVRKGNDISTSLIANFSASKCTPRIPIKWCKKKMNRKQFRKPENQLNETSRISLENCAQWNKINLRLRKTKPSNTTFSIWSWKNARKMIAFNLILKIWISLLCVKIIKPNISVDAISGTVNVNGAHSHGKISISF